MKQFLFYAAIIIATLSACSSDDDISEDVGEISGSDAPSSVKAVDLGLSVRWANMNVGAKSVTDYGDYFCWGETETKENLKEFGIVSSYKWYENGTYTKYGRKYPTLDAEDDAAAVNWGGTWRMPTSIEFEELRNMCYWAWTSDYKNSNVAGYIVYKAKSPSDKGMLIRQNATPSSQYSLSDTHIFLPAASHLTNGEGYTVDKGKEGRYWSCSWGEYSQKINSNEMASILMFDTGYHGAINNIDPRADGLTIRPVTQ